MEELYSEETEKSEQMRALSRDIFNFLVKELSNQNYIEQIYINTLNKLISSKNIYLFDEICSTIA